MQPNEEIIIYKLISYNLFTTTFDYKITVTEYRKYNTVYHSMSHII